MLGYNYTENMIKDHLIVNAKSVGKLWANFILQYPTIYSDFWQGVFDEITSRLPPTTKK